MVVAIYTWINRHTLLYPHQQYYILLYTDSPLTILFLSFASNIYLVFSIRLMMTANKTNINRHQIRLIPEFLFIEYKIQVVTFESAVLKLQQKSKKRGEKSHKQFCFIFIQLFLL